MAIRMQNMEKGLGLIRFAAKKRFLQMVEEYTCSHTVRRLESQALLAT
jgi:hypothetical protein